MPIERIMDGGHADSAAADLIKLARSEGPSAEGRARILSNLDAALAASALTTLPAANAAAAAGATGATSSGLLKWLTIVGVGITLPIAGLFAWRAIDADKSRNAAAVQHVPEQSTDKPVPASESAAKASAEQSPSATASIKTVELAELPTASTRPASATAQDNSRAKAPTLAEELAAIQRARQAVSGGDGASGLRELDAYKARFPRGRLRPEASVLRIEALLQTGDRAAATALGERFIAANPHSAYAARVRSLLGLAPTR